MPCATIQGQREACRKWYRRHRNEHNTRVLQWKHRNKEKVRNYWRISRERIRASPKKKARLRRRENQWYSKNRKHRLAWYKKWRLKHIHRVRRERQERMMSRLRDPEFRKILNARQREYARRCAELKNNFYLRNRIARRMLLALKGNKKSDTTEALIGCTIQELREHLESLFRDGMTWANHGKRWVIDHIRPCCAFDLSKPSHQRACFHFLNMRPLGRSENSAKARIDKLLSIQKQRPAFGP